MPSLAAAIIHGVAKRMPETSSEAELLEAFDKNLATGRSAMAGASDDHLTATIVALNMTRVAVLRGRVMNHMIHHRGQLSVYLRLLDVAGECMDPRRTRNSYWLWSANQYCRIDGPGRPVGTPASARRSRRRGRRPSPPNTECYAGCADFRIRPSARKVRAFQTFRQSNNRLSRGACRVRLSSSSSHRRAQHPVRRRSASTRVFSS